MGEITGEDWRPFAMPGAIMLSAILLAGAMVYSASNVTSQLNSLEAVMKTLDLTGAANPGGNIPTATPTPVATPGGNGGDLVAIDTTGLPFRGTADAPVTIVAFSDFQCPYCSRGATTIDQLMAAYPGQIKFVFMHFPLGFHENAQKAAEAFECAADQGKAYEMHDKMFANQAALTVSNLKGYAVDIGLDATTFNTCLDSGGKAQKVSAQTALGTQNGVEGTPTFIINGKVLVGAQPIETSKAAVDAALAAQ